MQVVGLVHQKKSVNLLLTEDEDEAVTIADKFGMDNRERQSIEKEILASIDEEVRRTPNIVNDKILVFAGKGWHQGVVGIVASRIKEIYVINPQLLSELMMMV